MQALRDNDLLSLISQEVSEHRGAADPLQTVVKRGDNSSAEHPTWSILLHIPPWGFQVMKLVRARQGDGES